MTGRYQEYWEQPLSLEMEGIEPEAQAPLKGFFGTWMIAFVLLLLGGLLQALCWGTIGPLILACFFLLLGLLVLRIPRLSDRWSRRAFILTFSALVFSAGLNVHYMENLWHAGDILYTDENTYYDIARTGLGGGASKEYKVDVFPLPVYVWRATYSVCASVGLGDGPWIGVMVNALVVAFAANIFLLAIRIYLGPDGRRLCMVGTLFAISGLMHMLGSMFLRDAFALLINMFAFWIIVRALNKMNLTSFLIAIGGFILAAVGMFYVREGVTKIFFVYTVLAACAISRRTKTSVGPFVLVLVLLGGVIAVFPLISRFTEETSRFAELARTGYGAAEATRGRGEDSMALRFIFTQPLPIRLVVGSVYLLILPVPLWSGFVGGHASYSGFTALNGILMVILMPRLLVGVGQAFKGAFRGGKRGPNDFFVLFFGIVGLLATVGSSFRSRHMGQFLPALLVVAVLPDLRDPETKKKVSLVGVFWYSTIILIHICWMGIRWF